jgi:hypothetical protein
VFIDDATSRLMHLQFVESESTFAYFHATRAYLEAWGKPVPCNSGRISEIDDAAKNFARRSFKGKPSP